MLIVLMMIVLMPAVGLAEDEIVPTIEFLANQEAVDEVLKKNATTRLFLYQYDEQQKVWDRVKTTHCERKMREAMEAVDPYIFQGIGKGFADRADEGFTTYHKWQAVKQDCFK